MSSLQCIAFVRVLFWAHVLIGDIFKFHGVAERLEVLTLCHSSEENRQGFEAVDFQLGLEFIVH